MGVHSYFYLRQQEKVLLKLTNILFIIATEFIAGTDNSNHNYVYTNRIVWLLCHTYHTRTVLVGFFKIFQLILP